MPREIAIHHVANIPSNVRVIAEDEPGPGGANHVYAIVADAVPPAKGYGVRIKFQSGGVAEVGVNGVTMESLLAVVIDQLLSYQRGPLACRQNAEALPHLQAGMAALNRRTQDRAERGVEGTMQE